MSTKHGRHGRGGGTVEVVKHGRHGRGGGTVEVVKFWC